jgi:hypothetical protein
MTSANAMHKHVVTPPPVPSQESNVSDDIDGFAEMDFLCKFLGISKEEDASALFNFLDFMGSRTIQDLACIQKEDFEDYQKPLSRTIQRKLLLVADFMKKGGSLKEVRSFSRMMQPVKSNDIDGVNKSSSSPAESSDSDVIRLDVGGHKFTTTRSTLCRVPGSILEAMFSGRHKNPAQRQKDGSYVIDRNGMHFHHILDFLRVGAVISLPRDAHDKEALVVEADYYGLKDLVRAIRTPQVDTSEHLPQEVLSMRQEEDELRNAFINGSTGGFGPHRGLVSLFSDVHPLPLCFEPTENTGDSLLMDNLRENPPPGIPVTAKSLNEFKSNFNEEQPNLLHRLNPILQEEPVIIAGGAVLRALTSTRATRILLDAPFMIGEDALIGTLKSTPGVRTADWWGEKSDIDLFLHADTAQEATRIARRIFFALAVDNERWVIVRSRGVITMHNWVGTGVLKVGLKVQIVLRLYDSPAEVLLGFDCDCCCCAYDGRDVWVTPRCLRALRTGLNILNPLHSWPNKPSYELRLAKYAFRGFPVFVPGLDKKRINYDYIRATSLRKLRGLARLLKIAFEMDASPGEIYYWYHHNDGPETEAFPRPPLKVKSLNDHAREELHDADLITRGMGSGYEGHSGNVIVPAVYGDDDSSDYMWWYAETFNFPMAIICAHDAWAAIADATGNAPEGVPSLLVDSWDTEKRSREYLNASMDAFDRDNIYYGHAYEQVA